MRPFLRTYAPTILSGIVLSLAFPRPHLFPLAWFALVPLLYRCSRLSPRETFTHFFLAGWVFHTIVLQWLMTNLYWAGGWAIWGQQLMCLSLTMYWGLTGLAWRWLADRHSYISAALLLAVLWAAMEQLQATLFTGFGWGSIAYSQGPDLPLLQWTAFGGAPFVSAIIVYVNGVIAQTFVDPRGRLRRFALIATVIAFAHASGYAMLGDPDHTSKPFNVALIQSSYPLEMKWDPDYTVDMVHKAVQKSAALTRDNDVDLIVWPEALVMTQIENEPVHTLLTNFTASTGIPLFTGSVRRDTGPEIGHAAFNSAYLIDNGAIDGHYDKMHLAPFGEYVPFANLLPFIDNLVPMIGGLTPGTAPKVFEVGERKLGPLICFEMLFTPMAARLRADGADFLVVITNLSWFGASNAIPQELEISRVRAIETRTPLVHCANTGISGVFDPFGRFTPLNTYVDRTGGLSELPENFKPADTIRMRLAGVLPLAAQENHRFAIGPMLFPWLAVALSAALAIAAALRRGAKSASVETKD